MIGTCPYPAPGPTTVATVEGLLYFVWEREAIRLARENGHPAPWTADPVLQKYKFTNIRRKDDRVSRWVIKNIIHAKENAENYDLWFTLLIVRLVNWPPTIDRLLYEEVIPCAPEDFNPRAFEHTIESFKKQADKVYSGAYMLYPTRIEPGGNKAHSVAKYIIGDVVKKSKAINYALWGKEPPSVEKFVTALAGCFGVSTFMAGQVAADLTYARGHLDGAADLYTFAPLGPGSMQGLNYLFGRGPRAVWTQKDFNTELIRLREAIGSQLDITDMTLHDVQNVMCEFSKYCRIVLGEGKPKTTYKPETEF